MPDLSSESTLDYCCNQCIEMTVKFVWKQGIKWESKQGKNGEWYACSWQLFHKYYFVSNINQALCNTLGWEYMVPTLMDINCNGTLTMTKPFAKHYEVFCTEYPGNI